MFIGDIDTTNVIFAVDSSNVGEFSRTWGYILDNNYDRFIDYPKIMYITNLCWGISTFGIALKIFPTIEDNYRKFVSDCIHVQEWNR